MKISKLTFTTILSLFLLISCGGGNEANNAEGFQEIENQIKDKFGKDAYFTELTIIYNEKIGNSVTVTVSENQESLKMEEWLQSQGDWRQTSDVTIEIPNGSKVTDFMFQLNEKINLKKLGELVEKSKQSLSKEKDLKNPKLHLALVKYPDTGEAAKAEYIVMLQPETGGTTFTYSYKLDGTFIEMRY